MNVENKEKNLHIFSETMSENRLFYQADKERVQKQTVLMHGVTRKIIEVNYKNETFKQKFDLLFSIHLGQLNLVHFVCL
jgi:hypothetical protein